MNYGGTFFPWNYSNLFNLTLIYSSDAGFSGSGLLIQSEKQDGPVNMELWVPFRFHIS